MKINIFILLFIPSLFFVISCGHSDTHHQEESHVISHDHEEESASIATLTQEQMKAIGLQLGKVESKELTATIKANGMLRVPNNNKGNATSLYGGVIRSIQVQIGEHVRKGQVIATIANPQFIQLQEEYLTIKDKLVYAEQEASRQQELNSGNAGAMKNLQTATAELNTLRTRKASLQKQIQLMGINPNLVSASNFRSALVVISPLDGVVSNVYAKIGSYVDVSSPVAEIVDNGSLHLDLQVFEKDLPLLKIGQTVHFTLTNNPVNEYDAKVFSIGSSFENDSKTISVHCRVIGNKAGLIDGMNITGIVSLNNAITPAVPNDAIVTNDGKDYIFIVTDKSQVDHSEKETHVDDHQQSDHDHAHDIAADHSQTNEAGNISFEKIEVVKGVSDMGYTAVTFVNDIPAGAKIVTQGAFFINAKLSNIEGHEH